jgi:hypothetical protein
VGRKKRLAERCRNVEEKTGGRSAEELEGRGGLQRS